MNNSQEKIANIKNLLRQRMNGIAAKAMKDNGAAYRLAYGVPIHELREIAATQEKDAEVAEMLWQSGVREEMMLAPMILPEEDMTDERIKKFATESPSLEVLMELSRSINTEKTSDKTLLLWADEGDENVAAISLMLGATRMPKMTDDDKKAMLDNSISMGERPSYTIAKAAAEYIKSYLNDDRERAADVEMKISKLSTSSNKTSRLLYEEIMTEIKYG